MKVIKVESIKIQLGGREIELTPEEAARLRDELDKVLPTKDTVRLYPYWRYPFGGTLTTPTIAYPYQPVWTGTGGATSTGLTFTATGAAGAANSGGVATCGYARLDSH